MAPRLANHLIAARQQRFVGRTAELALFESALAAPALPFAVLYLFRPGGVGKTMVLNQFAARCAAATIPLCHLDARDVEATPDAFWKRSPHATLRTISARMSRRPRRSAGHMLHVRRRPTTCAPFPICRSPARL